SAVPSWPRCSPRPGRPWRPRGWSGSTLATERAFRDQPRLAAYDVLRAVTADDAYANLVLPQVLRERGLSGRDAALATELVGGTLRGQGTYDAIVASLGSRAVDPPVVDAVRPRA